MRKSSMLAGALSLAVAGVASADVFGPGPGGLIPDSPATPPGPAFTSSITVPGGTVVSFNSITMSFAPAHTWVGDLVVTITAPNGENAHVFARTGSTTAGGVGDSSDLIGPYTFTPGPGTPGAWTAAAIAAAAAVPSGTYARETLSPLASPPAADPDNFTVFHGDPAGGTWTLTIQDWASLDSGGLASWSMDITIPEPASLGLLVAGAGLPLLRRRRR